MNQVKAGIKQIIFDLDGTLVDTEATAFGCLVSVMQELEIPLSPDSHQNLKGRTWNYASHWIFRNFQIPVLPDELHQRVISKYRDALHSELKLIPGSIAAVKSLAKVYPLALVTGSSRELVNWILTKLKIQEYFELTLAAEDYENPKPDPSSYLQAFTQLKTLGSSVLIFEDSEVGITAARRSGAWTVQVGGERASGSLEYPPHLQIQDLVSVDPNWVRQWGHTP